MTTITLSNPTYTLTLSTHGAEIQSFSHIPSNTPIIWTGDPSVWKNHAPILFPFIGRCVGGYYDIEGHCSEFTRNHGFARDVEHTLIEHDDTHAVFELSANTETLAKYPYNFTLRTEYNLTDKGLEWKLKVINNDKKSFGFSIGTHTAFACNPADCIIEFEKKTPLTAVSCTPEGYLAPFTNGSPTTFNYTKDEPGFVSIPETGFGNGSLFMNNNSDWIALTNKKTGSKSVIQTKGFKYIMLWQNTSGHGQFICIEPWHGLPDAVDTDHVWVNKPEMIFLKPGESFECEQDVWKE